MSSRIITLTTIPTRFKYLNDTLESLIAQNGQIDEVRLYIPKKFKRFPEYDGQLPDVPKGVNICTPDADFGPASKVLHAVQELQGEDVQILFCDDDLLYAKTWSEHLFSEQEKRPDHCVAAIGAPLSYIEGKSNKDKRLPEADIGNRFFDLPYKAARLKQLWQKKSSNKRVPKPNRRIVWKSGYADLIFGCGGVVIRPEFFDDRVYNIPDVIWAVDDIWLSGMLAVNNVPVWLPKGVYVPSRAEATDVSSLASSIIGGADRSSADAQCAEYFQENYGIWQL